MRKESKIRNKYMEKDFGKGSLTVEALLFLIPFIMAFCTLINAARFVQAEMLIHHAITQTAKQISTYSYVLTKAEIPERLQDTNRKSQQFIKTVEESTASIEEFAEAVGDRDAMAEGVFNLAKSMGEHVVLTSVAGMLSENNIKNAIALMSDDPDEFLEVIGIEGGLSGLDFSQSQWISDSEGKGNIQIVVRYSMKNVIFPEFAFGPYEFCQCASTLIW